MQHLLTDEEYKKLTANRVPLDKYYALETKYLQCCEDLKDAERVLRVLRGKAARYEDLKINDTSKIESLEREVDKASKLYIKYEKLLAITKKMSLRHSKSVKELMMGHSRQLKNKVEDYTITTKFKLKFRLV